MVARANRWDDGGEMMSNARTKLLENAIASAGQLISALEDEGPINSAQARS